MGVAPFGNEPHPDLEVGLAGPAGVHVEGNDKLLTLYEVRERTAG